MKCERSPFAPSSVGCTVTTVNSAVLYSYSSLRFAPRLAASLTGCSVGMFKGYCKCLKKGTGRDELLDILRTYGLTGELICEVMGLLEDEALLKYVGGEVSKRQKET
jgi:hypothetical protein